MAQVPDDFGLIECAGCKAPLIVHMDGRVEFSGVQEASEPANEAEFDNSEPHPEPIKEAAFDFGPSGEAEFELEPGPPVEPAHEPEPEILEPPAPDATIANFATADEEISDKTAPMYKPEAQPETVDLSDIARFGNSNASSTGDGALRYNLFISGIDTSDVREAFREAITDRKLVWDTEQILRSVKNGEVGIQNVPPTKAYILVSRLRNLPVQVRWEQYAVSQG